MHWIQREYPLTDFRQKTDEVRGRLRRTGQPEILTVEGRPELVVQDAEAYQKLLDELEDARTHEAIRKGLEEMMQGIGRPMEEVDAEMRSKYGIPRRGS
jgi:PHD/YefM family antitoxin component YafN of YafNO toxin-antitoxin module